MTKLIELNKVKKHYEMGDNIVKAVDGISIGIEKGDFVAIMGPSGSGKSTAMNLVGSLDLPTQGEIYLDKKDIAHLDESQLAQIRGKKNRIYFPIIQSNTKSNRKRKHHAPNVISRTRHRRP